MTRFVVVPQWQGSGSSRAMQLIDGATAIAGDLPRSATTVLEVPVEAGETLGTGVHRLSSLRRIRGIVDETVAPHTEPVLLVGGDCGVAVAGIGHALARHEGVAVVWIDAHPDLNDPESSRSQAFHGMALRAALGEGVDGLTLQPGIPADRVVLAGTRALEDAEASLIAERRIRMLSPADFSPEAVVAAVRETGADKVYIHVDLDVLDPSEITGVSFPEPFGLAAADLIAAVGALRAEFTLVGSSLTEFSPSSAAAAVDDLGTILRIVGALA